ncbi:MAG: hydrogenase expression/formation protein HypE [Lentisphaeria bacterium]|nr:hydrogenase expression/formation protein HypE [Lentisphaeria bacterium]
MERGGGKMDNGEILLAHGAGGHSEREFIETEILSRFGSGPLAGLPDAAELPGGLIFSTDSFVVNPIFFPGGNIGKLAVCGTVNDVCMGGGIPKYLALSLILEEGFSRRDLTVILDDIARYAKLAQVEIVTGDTKVVTRGAADKIFINTSGIGLKRRDLDLGRHRFQAGDKIVLSGTMGEHGFAVLAARHGIDGSGVGSDCTLLKHLVEQALAAAGNEVKFMRDPTRGGVGSIVQEIIEGSQLGAKLFEDCLPISPGVKAMSTMTGIDPLFVACEGRVVFVVAAEKAERLVAALNSCEDGRNCAIIGELTASDAGEVVIENNWGGARLMIQPDGDAIPRIC